MNIGVCGAAGRMGTAIMRLSLERGHVITAAFDAPSSPHKGKDVSALVHGAPDGLKIGLIDRKALTGVDGLLDFSSPSATMMILDAALEASKPLVIGTTGLDDGHILRIKKAAEKIPLLQAPNMSAGVNLLFRLTELAAGVLREGFDVEVFEAHHRLKKDAPSGTAKRLIEIIRKASPALSDAPERYDRSVSLEERKNNEIGVQVLRGGDIVGEHTVFFSGMGERIELTHRATNRDILARGALRALEFLVRQKPGFYTMFDVLGI